VPVALDGGQSLSHLSEHLALLHSRLAGFLGYLAEFLGGLACIFGGLAEFFRHRARLLCRLAAALGSRAPCFGVAPIALGRFSL
jgi:hypothetical protein